MTTPANTQGANEVTNMRLLMREWLADSAVVRVMHDDDGEARLARLRPTTPLTVACAGVLQGLGFITPVGDGSFMVTWTIGGPLDS